MKTRIYGASDDLIEIDGAISEEHDCYDHKKPIKITVSDGTIADIFYNGDWIINVHIEGGKFIKRIESVGDDGKHTDDAEGCESYSDVIIFEPGIEWIKIGSKTYKE